MIGVIIVYEFFCFKQKTAYEMRISDWSSDVCSSDLSDRDPDIKDASKDLINSNRDSLPSMGLRGWAHVIKQAAIFWTGKEIYNGVEWRSERSEEHTSELQSIMRISYAVFCLKKKRQKKLPTNENTISRTYHAHISQLSNKNQIN